MILLVLLINLLIGSMDFVNKKIYNSLNIINFVLAVIYAIEHEIEYSLLGAIVGVGIFLIVYSLTDGGLGEGDIKYVGSLGIYVGYPNILFLVLSACLLSFPFFKLIKKRKAQVLPFAPFLAISLYLILFLKSSSF